MNRIGLLSTVLALGLLVDTTSVAGQEAYGGQQDVVEQTLSLTLRDAVELALRVSPEARRAAASEKDARSARLEAWDRLLPSVNASTVLDRREVLFRTAEDPVSGEIVTRPEPELMRQFRTRGWVNASWRLFDGGTNIQAFRAARAEGRAAEAELATADARIVASVTTAFLDALEAQALEQVARAQVVQLRELERTAEGRFQVGEVSWTEVLTARVRTGDQEIELLEAEAAVLTARLALAEHLPMDVTDEVSLVEPPEVSVAALPGVRELEELAVSRSPRLEMHRARVEAAEHTSRAGRWWFLPSVSVVLEIGRSELGQTTHAITGSPRNQDTFVGLNLSWSTLQQPLGSLAERQRASTAVTVARAELESERRALATRVAGALERLRRAEALARRSAVNLELAHQERQAVESRYRVGAATVAERLEVEALVADARRQEIVARFLGLRAVAELTDATGTRVDLLNPD